MEEGLRFLGGIGGPASASSIQHLARSCSIPPRKTPSSTTAPWRELNLLLLGMTGSYCMNYCSPSGDTVYLRVFHGRYIEVQGKTARAPETHFPLGGTAALSPSFLMCLWLPHAETLCTASIFCTVLSGGLQLARQRNMAGCCSQPLPSSDVWARNCGHRHPCKTSRVGLCLCSA